MTDNTNHAFCDTFNNDGLLISFAGTFFIAGFPSNTDVQMKTWNSWKLLPGWMYTAGWSLSCDFRVNLSGLEEHALQSSQVLKRPTSFTRDLQSLSEHSQRKWSALHQTCSKLFVGDLLVFLEWIQSFSKHSHKKCFTIRWRCSTVQIEDVFLILNHFRVFLNILKEN